MYSNVLFMVDASLKAFRGSGESPTSAVERYRRIMGRSARPVKVT